MPRLQRVRHDQVEPRGPGGRGTHFAIPEAAAGPLMSKGRLQLPWACRLRPGRGALLAGVRQDGSWLEKISVQELQDTLVDPEARDQRTASVGDQHPLLQAP